MLGLLVGFRIYFYKHYVAEGLEAFARTNFDFTLLLLTIGIISSAGYLVNDIFDVETDKVNKPTKKLPYNKATLWVIYSSMNIFAVILTFIVSDNIAIKAILLGTIIALYLYSFIFQKLILIGNFIIAFLSGLLPFVYLFFEGISINTDYDRAKIGIVIFYSIIAFSITLLREVIKDKQDEKGDQLAGYRTLSNSISLFSFNLVTVLYLVVSSILTVFFILGTKLHVFHQDKMYFWLICYAIYISSSYFILKGNYKRGSLVLKLTLFIGILFLYLL